jgi:hypothetical protein
MREIMARSLACRPGLANRVGKLNFAGRGLNCLSTGLGKVDMRGPKRIDRRAARPRGGKMKLLLLLVPCVIALWAPLYNTETPALFGMPFFYWFQLALIPVSALAIYAADKIGKA